MRYPHPFTSDDIRTALADMRGYIDISIQDVDELLTRLYAIRRLRKKQKSTPMRFIKYHWLKTLRKRLFRSKAGPRVRLREVAYSWATSFAGIAAVALTAAQYPDWPLIIGSFGASAVLIYGAVRSPFAQPRNLVGGHVFSALVGVTCFNLFPVPLWFCAAMAVSLAIALMLVTNTIHPPGGATALIAVIGSDAIHNAGYWYVLCPVFSGVLIMLAAALICNNLLGRKYPEYWV